MRRARPAPQIGVGKSTLLKRLRKQLADNSAVTFVDEPVEIWEAAGLLAAMYDGTLSHAAFQLTALTTRYAALAHALKVPGVELVIAERSLGSDRRVFAHTHLGELEFRAYAAAPPRHRAAARRRLHRTPASDASRPPARSYAVAHDALTSTLDHGSATVLLDAPVDTLQARIRTRGRAAEDENDTGSGVDSQYLGVLDDAHAAYFDGLDGAEHPKVKVSAAGTADEVAAQVMATIESLLNTPPGSPGSPTSVID